MNASTEIPDGLPEQHPAAIRLRLMRRVLLGAVTLVVLLVMVPLSGYRFLEDDSVLYSQISAQLADRPLGEWMTPLWPSGRWKSGLFEEHTAVFFWPPAVLGMLGLPPTEAILAVNLLYLTGCVLLGAWLLRRRCGVDHAHAFAMIWLCSPGPLTYLYRGNHESALALGMLAAVAALDRVEDHRGWGAMAVAAMVWCFAVKGVVGLMVVPALGLWWLMGKREFAGLLTVALGTAAVLVFAGAYDAAYLAKAGHGFWETYLDIHIGYAVQKEEGAAGAKLANLAFYSLNALWLVFPWSLVVLGALFRRARGTPMETLAVRCLVVTGFYVVFLSSFDRRSIRYAFTLVPWMALASAPLLLAANQKLARLGARLRPVAPELLMVTAVLLGAARLYVHNNHYRYISTQG